MTIPDFQSTMLPLLSAVGDGGSYHGGTLKIMEAGQEVSQTKPGRIDIKHLSRFEG